MTLFRRRMLLAAGLALPVSALPLARAAAQLRVDITRGRVEPTPIAISPFAGVRERGADIARVVANDLESSGLFEVIDPAAYIQRPGELVGLPRFADWRQIDAQALVTGTLRQPGPERIDVEFRLWDVFAGTQMRGLRFEAAESDWRRVAHKIADVVYERITGEPGYFDTRIAYIAESGPPTQRIKRLAIMDQDGANHRFLTDGRDLVLTPQIAPDGRHIAYLAYRSLVPQVVLHDLSSGEEARLGDFSGMTFSPRFAPNDDNLLLTVANAGNSDIIAYEPSTGRTARLTTNSAIDTSPSFSPDGSEITFNSDRGGSPQLYIMNRDGTGQRRISFGDGRYGSPAWSPRGDFIAFTKIKGGFFHIGLMRPDGSDERLLTRSFLDESPTWAPNGRIILFSRQDPVAETSNLRAIDITGYNERLVPTPLDASDPDWSPPMP